MKRYLALALGLLMLLGMMAGCTGTPAAQSAAPADSSAKTAAPEATAAAATDTAAATEPAKPGEPVTITLFTMESDSQWNLADTPNFKKLQETILTKFNAKWELETALSKEFETTVTTRFASGEKLPDIINYRYPDDKLVDLYKNGLIIKLNDLIDQNAPDYNALLKIRPYLVVANGDRDGNILRIPAQYIENIQHRIYVLNIRNDWLKAVGMTEIKTPDDLYNALKLFQEKDVNGSGKPDEVMTAFNTGELNRGFSSAFGVKNMLTAADSWYFDANGKVYNTFLTPEAKEYVTFMAKLYAAKLLDPSYMNQTGEQYNEKLYNNRIASRPGMWWDSVLMSMAVDDKGFKDVEYIPIMPPASSDGKPTVYLKDLPGYSGYMFTKDCDDPATAMKVVNWGYTTDGSVQNYYGESMPGGDYYRKATALEGLTLPDYQMEYTEKGNAAQKEEPQLWQKMGWNQEFTTKVLLGNADAIAQEFFQAFGTDKCGLGADIQFNMEKLKLAEFTYNIPAINFVAPTADQVTQWEGFSDLWVYMDEQISKFVTGVEPIDKWDAFAAQCETMGIKDATAIKQEQYDTYNKVMAGLK